MHTYDASSSAPYQSQIPSMRVPHDSVAGSGTPIFDALCAEYRRLFRALPGDRTGEENLHSEALRPWRLYERSPVGPAAPPAGSPPQPYNARHRGIVRAALPPGPTGPTRAPGHHQGPYDNRMHGR